MARQATYAPQDFLDAAEDLVAAGGPRALTIESLVKATGAPVGSVYHRFRSRSVLAAELWIGAVERFQTELIAHLNAPDPMQGGLRAALHTLQWSRRNLSAARILLLYRDVDFVAEDLPQPWSTRAKGLNAPLLAALRAYATRRYGTDGHPQLLRVGLAIIDVPYGAVHRYLAAMRPIPADLDGLVAETVTTLLAMRPA
jgi:AcrR family transcriptional regulator